MKNMRFQPVMARGAARSERGFILIVGMFFLIILTILSIAMFRSVNLQQRIAGNSRDKERALEAAQSALQYGEWWLGQGKGGTGSACSGVINGNLVASMMVCSAPLAGPTTLPWPTRIEYVPPAAGGQQMTVAAGGGLSSGLGSDINYQAKPGLYISYLGLSADGLAQLFQVTGFGYGGESSTAAVVRSTYQIKTGAKPLDGL